MGFKNYLVLEIEDPNRVYIGTLFSPPVKRGSWDQDTKEEAVHGLEESLGSQTTVTARS